ncbi:hypothetical protein [Notoacmeibacter ruber]|uniref:AIPR protein n=1 Tax=Notoacmeibacter ruber TaxID=2670375 RepID=A0A3L7JBT0_9HYPH|nr:hypothetical protein [Notoacmeibacter ruber]RLQ88208.1 hypothetical protein D8780_08330 [Notoacmeibacter ruber]
MSKNIILKIEQCSEQECGPVRKIIGLIGPKSFCQLIDAADLSANPRSAKKGAVTSDIETSLAEKPELFPAMTKGILIAASNYKELERQRYRLTFEDTEVEGLLDGGHNALATGRHVLTQADIDEKTLRRAKDWDSFSTIWAEKREEISDIEELLEFEMPVEIQVPAKMSDPYVVSEFKSSLLEIGSARNNNAQLTEETKGNKQGLYDDLKSFLPAHISQNVEWKSNDGGRIKVRELLALSWIPLGLLELPNGIHVLPNQIYRNKAVCVDAYNRLLKHPDVSSNVEGGYDFELTDGRVEAALRIAADLPDIYDSLYAKFPDAYNKSGGAFGKINAVRMYVEEKTTSNDKKYLKNPPRTPFRQDEVKYTCPDGFLIPFLYGMRSLMAFGPDGLLKWAVDPDDFISEKLVDALKSYRLAIELGNWDPQQVGKKLSAYDFSESAIRNLI